MERADALMTRRKTTDDVIVKEKAELRDNGQPLSDLKTGQSHPFDPDFQVQRREGDRHGQPDIDMSGAPRLTTDDIKNYSSLTAEQRMAEQQHLQSRITDGREKISDLHKEILRQDEVLKKRELSAQKDFGDKSVTTASRDEIRNQLGTIRGEVSYQRRLKEDMQMYDTLPASRRAHFMETIDSLRDHIKIVQNSIRRPSAIRTPRGKTAKCATGLYCATCIQRKKIRTSQASSLSPYLWSTLTI